MKERFDDLFDQFESREIAREIIRQYIGRIESDVDREIALRLHDDRISEQATNQDIIAILEGADLHEIESLYGNRVWMAADRGRRQRNYSALRCFVREVRRRRSDLRRCLMHTTMMLSL